LRYLFTEVKPHTGALARRVYKDALDQMQEPVTPEATRLRGSKLEHPFATIKYHIFGHPCLLMRGLSGARMEIGLATDVMQPQAHGARQRLKSEKSYFFLCGPRVHDNSRCSVGPATLTTL
jgi:hypothetical protein